MAKRRAAPAEDEPALDMSSMIDVSFLLLIYFLVTSTLDPKEADLGFTLPTTEKSNSVEIELDQSTIVINAQGHVLFNDETVDTDPEVRQLSGLKAKLIDVKMAADAISQKPLIIVSADDGAKGQRFVDVLNTLGHKDIAITSVTLTGFTEDK